MLEAGEGMGAGTELRSEFREGVGLLQRGNLLGLKVVLSQAQVEVKVIRRREC
jgi:hypothetical protein